jgi:lysophospholipase L1-like esterase/pimeloyl-ACP methyl ester carboxylesterase
MLRRCMTSCLRLRSAPSNRFSRPGRFFLLTWVLLLTTPGLAAAPDQGPSGRWRVACIGDSITEGAGTRMPELEAYPVQLQRMLDPAKWLVEGFGVSGATLMNRGDKPYQRQSAFADALAFAPDIVVIMLGTNDTKPQNWRYRDDFVADFRDLIARFRALPVPPRIFVSRPIIVVGEGNFGINDAALQELLPLLDEVAQEEQVSIIDQHATLQGHESLVPDRVHPNAAGAERLARAVYEALTGRAFAGALSPVRQGEWKGFRRLDFESDGRAGFVIVPHTAAPGRPWMWRTEFFGHEPQTDLALLERGWHVAYVNVQNLFGSPTALDAMDQFYTRLRQDFQLASRVVLVGFSRGGLFAFNWAARHPERVASIYVDAPVLDLRSWPAGKGQGTGSPVEWERCLQAYGLPAPELFASPYNPVNSLQPLVDAGIPVLSVCGDADRTVPFGENTAPVAQRYRELGGTFEVIVKPGVGHHPHSLVDPAPIVDFILQHAAGPARPREP